MTLADYSKSQNFTKTYRRLEQIAKAVTNKNQNTTTIKRSEYG